jgi:hypothetical protein
MHSINGYKKLRHWIFPRTVKIADPGLNSDVTIRLHRKRPATSHKNRCDGCRIPSGTIGFGFDRLDPTRWLDAMNVMKRKISFCESGAEQDEAALLPTFRAGHDVRRYFSDCLPDGATARAPESDVDTRVQSGVAGGIWLGRTLRAITRHGQAQRAELRGSR